MNVFKSLITSLLIAGGALFSACTDEDIYEPIHTGGDGSLTLQLSVPDPIVIQPETRAGVSDFNTITDLNVVIASGSDDNSTIEEVFYYTYGTADGSESSDTYYNGEKSIHFSKEYVGEKGLTSKSIFVVANLKEQINESQITTVGELRSIQQKAVDEIGVVSGTILFGEAKDPKDNTQTEPHGGALKEIELERTVAMITLVIDGTELNENVQIEPTQVSLCNVPRSCFIGKANIDLANNSTNFNPRGEFKPAGEMGLAVITRGETTGKHFDGNYTTNDVSPFFLFENLHTEAEIALDMQLARMVK